jgi:hypothetical protein
LEVPNDAKVFGSLVSDIFSAALANSVSIDEVCTNAKGECTGFQEISRGGKRDAAGRDHVYVGKRSFETAKIFGSAHRIGGKDFDDVGAGAPGRKDLGGGEGAGQDGDRETLAEGDRGEIERGTDDELGAAVDGTLRGVCAEYSARADEKFGALLFETADDHERFGNGHGDLQNVNAGISLYSPPPSQTRKLLAPTMLRRI